MKLTRYRNLGGGSGYVVLPQSVWLCRLIRRQGGAGETPQAHRRNPPIEKPDLQGFEVEKSVEDRWAAHWREVNELTAGRFLAPKLSMCDGIEARCSLGPSTMGLAIEPIRDGSRDNCLTARRHNGLAPVPPRFSFDGSAREDGLPCIAHPEVRDAPEVRPATRSDLRTGLPPLLVVLHGTFSTMRPVKR